LRADPAKVIRSIPADDVLKRIFALEKIYQVNFANYPGAYLNRKLLRHAIESYFIDLERMKDFHGIKLADQHKRAAFTMLWIVKAHPVQLHTNADMTEALIVINELFAIHAGLAHLRVSSGCISKECLRNLIYTLHFRQVSPEILASAMYLLECACLQKTP
jgi:hypothetical protein